MLWLHPVNDGALSRVVQTAHEDLDLAFGNAQLEHHLFEKAHGAGGELLFADGVGHPKKLTGPSY